MAEKQATRFRKGDRVEWSSHGGTRSRRGVAVGTVVKKLTSPMTIKGHRAKASAEDPQYLVRSDNGGKAAHKPSALRRSSTKAPRAEATDTKKGAKKKGAEKGRKKGAKGAKKKGAKKGS